MNYSGTFDAKLPADGSGLRSDGHAHVESITQHAAHAPAGAIIVEDSQLLFNGDFKRSGVDLVLSKDDHQLVLHDYFKGEKHAALSSPDGAHLTGDIVDALTGHTQYAQADGSASASHVIGHVTKLVGNATVIRNGVSVILNNGDNVEKGDVVQAGSNSTLGVTFIDGTVFGLSSNARMVLNEMVYDPNGSNNSSLISLVAGTISFVAGETAKHGDMKVDTPVATMGIRGTAVLCEIDFNVPGQGDAPDAHFQVLVEPDGTTGSYILFDKQTLAPIAELNKAGQQLNISHGQFSISDSALPAEIQKLIGDVFNLKFSDANPQTLQHFTDSITQQSLQPIQLANGPTAIPIVINLVTPGDTSQKFALPPTNSNQHIDGPPKAAAFGNSATELVGKTYDTTDHDTASGKVNFVDINAGDAPTVSTAFDHYTYTDASGHVIATKGLQLADIQAVEAKLVVVADPGNNNNGSATWTYSVADNAFDFLAAGETLTLTYMARIDNNYAPNDEATLVPFTITITGTNDAPVITTGPQFISFTGGTTTVGGPLTTTDATKGTLSFTDVDLTDTHQVKAALTGTVVLDAHGNAIAGFTIPPTPLAAFEAALTASIAAGNDSTGSGNGTINWTLANFPAYLADFIPSGDTVTLTYTVTVTDSQNAISTQNITVNITGNNAPAEVWIATTASGTGDWNTGTNWESGLVPTASEDAIIITNQLVGKTPLYPVTITAGTHSSPLNPDAVANSLTMNDFGSTAPVLDNNGVLKIGGTFDLFADSVVNNTRTLTVGGTMELLAQIVNPGPTQNVIVDSVINNSNTGTISVGGKMELLDLIETPGPNPGQSQLVILNQSTLLNSGTIDLGQGGDFQGLAKITNTGLIDVKGGTLNVLVDIINFDINHPSQLGQITVDSGATIALGTDPDNNPGIIGADPNNNPSITGAITGGTVTINGTLDLQGANFLNNGTLVNNAQINVTGTGNSLDNESVTANSALEIMAGASLLLDQGTSVANTGTITIDNGATLALNDATINGGTINDGTLPGDTAIIHVTGSSKIDSAASLNNGTVNVDAATTLTLDGITVTGTTFNDANASTSIIQVDNGDTLTLSAVTINGGTINDGTLPGGTGIIHVTGSSKIDSAASLNNGTVNLDTSTTLTLDGVTVTGTDITDKGSIELDNNVTLTGGAIIQGQTSLLTGAITNLGTLEIAGAATLLYDVLTNTGHDVQVDASQTLNFDNSTITGGTLTISGELDSTGTSFITGATIINTSHIDIISGTLTIDPAPFTNTGTMQATDGGTLVIDDETITNSVAGTNGKNGTIQVDGTDVTHHVASTLDLEGSTIDGGNVTVSGVLDSTGNSFLTGADVTYSGTIDVTGGTLTIDKTSTLNNTGTGKLETNGGHLIVDTSLSGNLEIKGASLLELGSALQDAYKNATVTFDLGSTGTLKLDHADAIHAMDSAGVFTGLTVSGLEDDNTLDLSNIAFGTHPTVTYTGNTAGGILSIFVGTNDVSDIHLSGDYTGVHWVLSSDGASGTPGTDVTEAPGALTGLDSHGNAVEATPVTVSVTDDGQAVSGASYHWQLDGKDISGATGVSYTPTEANEGHALTVSITFTDAANNLESSSVSAGTVQDIALAFTSHASITGTAQEGSTLTAVNGVLNDSDAKVTGYQWQYSSDGGVHWNDITTNGTSQTYTPIETDEGHLLHVIETATDSDGGPSTTSISAATAAVSDIKLAFTSAGSITGTAQEGVTLTAVNGTLNDSDAAVTGWQWESASTSNGTYSIIAGATSSTYTLREANEDKFIKVVETASDPDNGGFTTTSTSAATAAVAEASLVPNITAGTNTHGTATFNVNFAVAMTGVTSADFTLFTSNGFTLLDNINVSGSGAHYTVTVTYPKGGLFSETQTSLGLNFVNSIFSTVKEAGDGSPAVSTHITTPQFSSLAPAGLAGYAINLSLADPTADPGDMITLTIAGAAADWNMNSGTHNSDGSWTVQTNDPASLMVTPSASFVGAALVHVTETWTNPDGSLGNALITDNVEAYALGSPIFALAGDDHLTGAGANDLFAFAQPIGHDVIYNFNAASDKIDLVDFNNVSGFADIQGHIADDASGNAVITIGANETITLNGVHAASLTASDFVFDQTPVTQNAGSMTIADGAILPLSGIINNTGTIELNSAGNETDLQLIEHGMTLQGGGQVVLSDSGENVIAGTSADVTLTNVDNTISGAGQIGGGQLTLINDAHGIIAATGALNQLTIDTGSGTFTNHGTVLSNGAGGLEIKGSVTSDGLLEADAGLLKIDGDVSGGGHAVIDGGSMEFGAASDAIVQFSGNSGGTLALDQPAEFTGRIAGMTGSGDVLDLAGFDAAHDTVVASTTGGYNSTTNTTMLTVSDSSNPANPLHLTLAGDVSAATWAVTSDGHGGADIVEPSAATNSTLGPVIMIDPGPAAGGNTIVASTANQTLTGSGAGDTFVFNFTGFGQDTVANFHPAADMLQLGSQLFTTAQAALNAALDDGHGNTVITLDAHDTITLAGIAKAQLHVTDFHVV